MFNDFLPYILAAISTVISGLIGVVWKILRDETKAHTEQLREKADQDMLADVETRLSNEIKAVKENNEKLINKLEARHDRDLEQLSTRLTEHMRNMEGNILTQMRMMVEFLEKRN